MIGKKAPEAVQSYSERGSFFKAKEIELKNAKGVFHTTPIERVK